jgi:hypothetical protein
VKTRAKTRRLYETISGVALAGALSGFLLLAASDPITILVRDARTHYAVRAVVKLQGPESVSLQTGPTGLLNHMVSTGKYAVWYGVEVSALGYKLATNRFLPGLSSPLTVMLVPEKPPAEEQPETVALRMRAGYTLLQRLRRRYQNRRTRFRCEGSSSEGQGGNSDGCARTLLALGTDAGIFTAWY